MAGGLIHETVWLNKYKYDDAERKFYESKAKEYRTPLAAEVGRAREWLTNIKKCIEEPIPQSSEQLPVNTLKALEAQVNRFTQVFATFEKKLEDLLVRVKKLEDARDVPASNTALTNGTPAKPSKPELKKPANDDDIDLFGSESEEDDAANEIREKRLAEYAAKKSKKPALIAKSNIILDVKPWDDETNMKDMEIEVRKIQIDGLVWGASKLVPLAYGIHKLQISCVVEDDLVSVDSLQEQIEAIEDYVQSVDIAAFNKV